MKTFIYIIESEYTANPEVILFATKEAMREQFVRDILEDNDKTLDGSDYENDEDVDKLKNLQQEGAPLDERFDIAQEIYERSTEDGNGPYYHGHNEEEAVDVPEEAVVEEDPLLPIPHGNYDSVRCPLCKEEHTMEVGEVELQDEYAYRAAECNRCGATWHEQLNVTGYTNLCDEEGNEIEIPQ